MSKQLTLSAALSVLAMIGVAVTSSQVKARADNGLPGLFSARAADQGVPAIGTLLPSLR